MRSTFDGATVRLYHLDDAAEGGAIATLFYGPLAQAMAIATAQPADVRDGLYLASDNDVIAWADLAGEDGDLPD